MKPELTKHIILSGLDKKMPQSASAIEQTRIFSKTQTLHNQELA